MSKERLIDANKLYRELKKLPAWAECEEHGESWRKIELFTRGDVLDVVRKAPAVDRERHGRWIGPGDDGMAECSECCDVLDVTNEPVTEEIWAVFRRAYRYCPNCGARMDLPDRAAP